MTIDFYDLAQDLEAIGWASERTALGSLFARQGDGNGGTNKVIVAIDGAMHYHGAVDWAALDLIRSHVLKASKP